MSSPELDLADNWEFTELWVDLTASPPYVLILLGDGSGNSCVYDRSIITYNSNQSLFQRLDIYILKPSQFFQYQLFLNCRNNRLNHRGF